MQKSFYSENTVVRYLKNSIWRDSTAKSPPKEERFGPKFPDPRALLMTSYERGLLPLQGRALQAPETDLRALPTRGDSALFFWGGLCCSFYNSVLR